MLARICLLVLLAVALATGRGTRVGEVPDDLVAELAELGAEDAVLVRVVELAAPVASPAPALVHGTEVDHPSPPAGRVFRPPRGAFA